MLTVAVCALALLSLVHLLVTLAVVRRLRDHAILLAKRPGVAAGGPIAPAGTVVGAFAATSTAGEPIDLDDRAGPTLVGFFSPGCTPCREAMPGFLDSARGNGGGRESVLAVVVGDVAEAAEAAVYVDALTPVARVVIEPPEGPVAAAFGVTGYPALAVVAADRTILASGLSLDDLAVAV